MTNQTWADLEGLFDRPGGSIVRGCWCMYYQKAGKVSVSQASGLQPQAGTARARPFGDGAGSGRLRRRLSSRLDLPRASRGLPQLERSRVMKAVDDTPVWSIVCPYVARVHRGKGYQHKLLAAAIDYARDQGIRTLEAYPVDKPERSHDDFMFFGSRSLYERAGFREVVRRSPTRS